MTRLPMVMALLPLVMLPAAAYREALGNPNATFRVNDMNLIDAMRLAALGNKLSPGCAAALTNIKPKSTVAARAEFFSGRIQESKNFMFDMLIPLFFKHATRDQYTAVITTALPPFFDLGRADTCRSYYLPGFHYCRIDVYLNSFRWGACVPEACTGHDVLMSVAPVKEILDEATWICGEDHFRAGPGTYFAYAVLALLAVLTVGGTIMEVYFRRKAAAAAGDGQEGAPAPLVRQTTSSRKRLVASKPLWQRIVLAWSLVTNYEILIRPTKFDEFTILDGIRGLSMLWVILGHCFSLSFQMLYPSDNERMLISTDHNHGFLQRWTSQAFPGGFLSVDSFFFMSAFLGTYYFLLHLAKLKQKMPNGRWLKRFSIEVPGLYIHRLLRISPMYYFVMMIYITIVPTLITGVPYTYVYNDFAACRKYWWQNFLYIQNLRGGDLTAPCYVPTWYLAVDTQLFLLLPFLALLGSINHIAGIFVCGLGVLGCMTGAALRSEQDHWRTIPFENDHYVRYFSSYYQKPWFRAPSYFIGIIAGIVWINYGDKLKEQVRTSTLASRIGGTLGCFLLCMGLVCTAVYVNIICTDAVPCHINEATMASFISLTFPFFVMGLGMLCFMLFLRLDYDVLIRPLLEARPLILVSRLSFGMYLTHYAIMLIVMSQNVFAYQFSEARFIQDYIGYVTSAILAGLVLHLVVERPFATLAAMLRPEVEKPTPIKAGPVAETELKEIKEEKEGSVEDGEPAPLPSKPIPGPLQNELSKQLSGVIFGVQEDEEEDDEAEEQLEEAFRSCRHLAEEPDQDGMIRVPSAVVRALELQRMKQQGSSRCRR